ncbi:MAG: EAL domain-containing protein [Rhodocyclaceae bacterium]|nr:EAL domain-containing protein [Rhodocyclaceae bacterium]
MAPQLSRQEALNYIRAKVDQLLTVMGTLPLRPEELDDETLVALDPIGIIADSFRQVLNHLEEMNAQLALATAEIRAIFDTLGAAVIVLSADDRLEDCNRLALEWFFPGLEKSALAGRPANEICPHAEELAALRRQADGSAMLVRFGERDLQAVATRIRDAAGQHAKTVMLFSDITAQKNIERHLELYSQVFRHIGEGILITDADTRIVEANEAVTRITGYRREELIGQRPSMLKSGLHEDSFYVELWAKLAGSGYWQGELFDRTRDGRIVPLLETISEVRDESGKLTHYIAVMTDISSLKETQTRLDFLAHHDALTELPNRLLFNDRLRHAIERAKRDGATIAVLFLDLDRFKNINDTLGHPIGDLLLIEAAKRLKGLIRRADTLARLGGDEFVILMENAASQLAAARLADKIVAAFKAPFLVNGLHLHIGCSIGIALYPEDGEDAMSLLKNADAAMYRAKEAGREGYYRYSAELSKAMQARLELDAALREAVRTEAFTLHYQPIIDLECHRTIACEALVRWPGAPQGATSPAHFIPLAEETRLIVPLGQWVLKAALAQLAAWQAAGLVLDYVSVNVSAAQLAQPDFSDQVISLLDSFALPGQRLQIELTENVLMADIDLCAWVFERLRERGVRIAIDDFGTGYSSLAYLKQLPIDNLKIDRSFVRDIPADANDCAIAAAIIALSHTLGLDVIAEGIETPAQQDFLTQAGCRKVQGYLHAQPLPAEALFAFAQSALP